jgi:hypothetical protein
MTPIMALGALPPLCLLLLMLLVALPVLPLLQPLWSLLLLLLPAHTLLPGIIGRGPPTSCRPRSTQAAHSSAGRAGKVALTR